jgi:hypothetical protein
MPDTLPPGTTVIEPPPAVPTDYAPEKESKK